MLLRRLPICFAFTLIAGAQTDNSGRAAYESRCARCHSGNATGGESGPNITAQISALGDAELAGFLRQGKPASDQAAGAYWRATRPLPRLTRYTAPW